MKIIHLNYSDINGGAARAAYRVHNSLIKESINSKMWVNKKFSDDWTVEGSTSKVIRILNELRPRLINHTLVKMLKTENKIIHSPSVLPSGWLKKINNSDADVVNLHWIQNEMMSVKDISKIKKPIVWTLHDTWAFCGAEHYFNDKRWYEGYFSKNRPNYETGFDLNRMTWLRKKRYWKKPIQIVCPSKWLANCVSKSVLMNNWPVSVIPSPIDTECWRPIDKKIARELLKLPENTFLILFGALGGEKDTRKGFDLLLAAFEYLKLNIETKKKIELVVFGQSKPKTQTDIGFPVHYLGYLQDDLTIRTAYSAADVMVIPSRKDNLPNTALEAQTCGTPVVSFDVGGLPDIIEHKHTGYIAKSFDIKDLAKGLSWVLDQNKTKQLNNNARDRSIIKYSEKKIANNYLSIYKNVLSQ